MSDDDDAAIAALLRAVESPYDLDGLRELVAGVAAAPAGVGVAEWVRLVAPDLTASQIVRLEAFRTRSAATPQGAPDTPTERLRRLRAELSRRGLAGFLVPRADEHQGEYVPKAAQRLFWLTGFSGSAGLGAVLAGRAALFVDGRYTIQAAQEVDATLFELRHSTDAPLADWLAEALGPGEALGYDPWLHTPNDLERIAAGAARAGARLVPVDGNPLDAVWDDRPPRPLAPVLPHDERFAGLGSAEKRRLAAEALEPGSAAVLTAPDTIAWLLNVRGADVPRTPLPLSFAILHADTTVDWFVDARKLLPELGRHLGNGVFVRAPESFGAALAALGGDGRRVRVDPATAAAAIFEILGAAGAEVVRAPDPCLVAKACKNPLELSGAVAAHRRDGVALARFLAWLDEAARSGAVGEIEASDRLEALRREGEHFRDLSFDTISGAGPNGAIVHYRASPESERRLEPGTLYLLDSGAQYLDGTTDVTRTIAIGTPSDEMRDRFTRVLKGHIAIATCRFPRGTTGSQLDALARRPLWDAGLDYDHGTGHGVGSFLSVHEGPQRIAKAGSPQALLPGMIVSNEPGYYKAGAWGIRIENLVVVREEEPPVGAERPLLGFDTLTLAPIDRRLVACDLLTAEERLWLDRYHVRVYETIGPLVDPAVAQWLADATRPLSTA